MINRLPKDYSLGTPSPASDARSGRLPEGFAPATPPLKERLAASAANSVGSHPVASLGVAFVVGILLGKLVKR